ncbi:MAG: tRNA pseudouridine(55) synthase TruB [Vicinamibacteria bacterium]
MTPAMPGLLLVHKPVGPTSAALVRERAAAAEASGARKLPMCHAGTLDPFASGLLVLAVGQATRAVDLLHDVPKEYEAEVAWGAETDNGDPLGTVVATGDLRGLTSERLDAALAEHVGWREQVPPLTSAQRVDGEYAYRKAHRGEVFTLPARRVFLHEARFVAHDLERGESRLFLRCGRGYYVRSLARDLGRALGCRAHLRALRRTAIGPWSDPGAGRDVAVTGEQLFPWLFARRLDDDEARRVAHGQPIAAAAVAPPAWNVPAGFPEPGGPVRALFGGRLVALLRPADDGMLAPFANLRGGL